MKTYVLRYTFRLLLQSFFYLVRNDASENTECLITAQQYNPVSVNDVKCLRLFGENVKTLSFFIFIYLPIVVAAVITLC